MVQTGADNGPSARSTQSGSYPLMKKVLLNYGDYVAYDDYSLIPNLVLKMGFDTGLKDGAMARLTHLSRLLDDRLNVTPNRSAAYVGPRAFAHRPLPSMMMPT